MSTMKIPEQIQTSGQTWSYSEYSSLVRAQAAAFQTSGPPTPDHIDATRLNAQRMKRLDAQIQILPELARLLTQSTASWTWLVLTETWCGDGGQTNPLFAKLASLQPSIRLLFTMRDENPKLMDQYLTEGTRSIPKLICYDNHTYTVIGSWGPRPESLLRYIAQMRKDHPGINRSDLLKGIHSWYAADKTESVQHELLKLIRRWVVS